MADATILIKDANGANRSVAADLTGGVFTPKHISLGPLTDEELRASAVPVSGPLTNTELRATPLPVSGPLTNGELRATAVPVSGPLTDAQLRASAVPVSGPATNAELRATSLPVKVVGGELPVTSGTYELIAGDTAHAPIAIPAGATAVRLFGDTKFRFAIDATPALPALNALGIGGFAYANTLREVRLPAGAAALKLTSLEAVISGGDPSPAKIDIEFVIAS